MSSIKNAVPYNSIAIPEGNPWFGGLDYDPEETVKCPLCNWEGPETDLLFDPTDQAIDGRIFCQIGRDDLPYWNYIGTKIEKTPISYLWCPKCLIEAGIMFKISEKWDEWFDA